jgi:hypothetical protein
MAWPAADEFYRVTESQIWLCFVKHCLFLSISAVIASIARGDNLVPMAPCDSGRVRVPTLLKSPALAAGRVLADREFRWRPVVVGGCHQNRGAAIRPVLDGLRDVYRLVFLLLQVPQLSQHAVDHAGVNIDPQMQIVDVIDFVEPVPEPRIGQEIGAPPQYRTLRVSFIDAEGLCRRFRSDQHFVGNGFGYKADGE